MADYRLASEARYFPQGNFSSTFRVEPRKGFDRLLAETIADSFSDALHLFTPEFIPADSFGKACRQSLNKSLARVASSGGAASYHRIITDSSSATGYRDSFNKRVIRQLTKLGFGEEYIGELDAVVSDAYTNAVIHGNNGDLPKRREIKGLPESHPGDTEKLVMLEALITREAGVFRITDQGSGFDTSRALEIGNPLEALESTGRGIFAILMTYTDGFGYVMTGRGFSLNFVKFR